MIDAVGFVLVGCQVDLGTFTTRRRLTFTLGFRLLFILGRLFVVGRLGLGLLGLTQRELVFVLLLFLLLLFLGGIIRRAISVIAIFGRGFFAGGLLDRSVLRAVIVLGHSRASDERQRDQDCQKRTETNVGARDHR